MKVSKQLVKKAIAVEMEKRAKAVAPMVAHVQNDDGEFATVQPVGAAKPKPQRRKYDRFKHRGRGVS